MKVSNKLIFSTFLFCCYPFFQLFSVTQIIFQIIVLYFSKNNINFVISSSLYLFFISLYPLYFLIFTNSDPNMIDFIRIISLSIPFLIYRLVSLEKLYFWIRPLFFKHLCLTSAQFFLRGNGLVRYISGLYWEAGIKGDLLSRVIPRAFGYWGPAAGGSFLLIFNFLVFRVSSLTSSFLYLILSIFIAVLTQSKTFLLLAPFMLLKLAFKKIETTADIKIKKYLIPFFLIILSTIISLLFFLGHNSMTYDFSSLDARFVKWVDYYNEYGNNINSLLVGVYDKTILKRPDSDILLILSMYGVPYTILFIIFYTNNLLRNNKNLLLFILNFLIIFIFAFLNPLLSCIPVGIFASVIILSSCRKEIN